MTFCLISEAEYSETDIFKIWICGSDAFMHNREYELPSDLG